MSTNVVQSELPQGNGGAPTNAALDRRLTVLETRFDTVLPTLATKADLEALRGAITAQLQTLRGDLFQALNEHFRWMLGIFITVIIAVSGAYYAMWTVMDRKNETHFGALTMALSQGKAQPAPPSPVPPEQNVVPRR
jgi:hypothetical protein